MMFSAYFVEYYIRDKERTLRAAARIRPDVPVRRAPHPRRPIQIQSTVEEKSQISDCCAA
jgi:hypothetical protein